MSSDSGPRGQGFERERRLLPDDGVAEASQTVHSSGSPINHSTHLGFNCPVVPEAASASSRFLRPLSIRAWPVSFDGEPRRESPSLAAGVGHIPVDAIRSRESRSGPTRPAEPPRFDPYGVALGVGKADDTDK